MHFKFKHDGQILHAQSKEMFYATGAFSGSLPITVRGMQSLEYFRAAENCLSGRIPSDLGKLTKLEYI